MKKLGAFMVGAGISTVIVGAVIAFRKSFSVSGFGRADGPTSVFVKGKRARQTSGVLLGVGTLLVVAGLVLGKKK